MCRPLNVSNFRVVLFSADFSCLKFMRFVTSFYQLRFQHATFLPVTVFLTGNQETQFETSRKRMDVDGPVSTMTVTLTV
jgi:hypothetical protein